MRVRISLNCSNRSKPENHQNQLVVLNPQPGHQTNVLPLNHNVQQLNASFVVIKAILLWQVISEAIAKVEITFDEVM